LPSREQLDSVPVVPDPAEPRAIYSIGAVSRMLAVPVATLRTWEERYRMISPTRSPARQRLYSRDQVEQLRFIRQQLEDGLTPADAHRLLAEGGPAVGASRAATPAAHRLLILLAERDPYAAELTEYFLRTEGYEVEVSLDAGDALSAFDRLDPDLTVVEWLISGGIGSEICRRLKATSAAPVVVISTLALEGLALEAGADAFVRKPIEPLAFVSTIKDLLGESALTRPAPVPVG